MIQYTVCPNNCWPEYCGVEVTVRDGHVIRLRGNPHHPISQGRLCARGQAALAIVDSPLRLTSPVIRIGSRGSRQWKETSWNEVLGIIAARMRGNHQVGRPHANAIYHSHGNIVNKVQWELLTPRFANMCSLTHWNGDVTCWYDVGLGLRLSGYFGRDSILDVGNHSRTVLIWAHDTATTMPSALPWLQKMKDRGGRLIVVDSRVTPTTILADLHLQPKPGTDRVLAGAIAREIILRGWKDDRFIEQYTDGFPAFRDALMGLSLADASQLTGVPEADIVTAARLYACEGPAAIDLSRGALGKQEDGWRAVWAIACLPALCGYIGRPGGGMIWEGNIVLNQRLLAKEAREHRPYPQNHYAEIIRSLEAGEVDALLIWGANPLSQWPNLPRLRRAMERVGLIVVWDLFMNQTAEQVADVVLPATCWLEETGLKMGATHVYYMPKILDAPGECRPGHWIQKELAQRLGCPDFFPWDNIDVLLDEALDSSDCRGLTVARLAESPAGLEAPGLLRPPYSNHHFDTPNGRFAFASTQAERLGLGYHPFAARLQVPPSEAGGRDYPLRLISSRRPHQFHSFYGSNAGNRYLHQFEPAPVVQMHPRDAARRGIEDGAEVVIFNQRGRAQAKVEWTTEVGQGMVSMDDGWPALNEVSSDATSILPEVASVLGMGGLPAYQDTFVEVRLA